MKLFNRFHLAACTFFLLISFSACNIDPLQGEVEIQTALDHFFAQDEFGFIQTVFDLEAQRSDELNKTQQANGLFCSCSTILISENTDGTFRMEVDYGTGCICLDGRTRSGKLIGIFNGKWNVNGATVNISADNYQVTRLDGTTYSFSFNKRITRIDQNQFSVQVSDAALSSDAGTIKWASSRTVEWTSGMGDDDYENNEYLIRGSATGTSIDDLNFSVNIIEPLKVLGNCSHVVSGVLSLTPENKEARTIDYGNGECDAEAILSIFGFSRTINLN